MHPFNVKICNMEITLFFCDYCHREKKYIDFVINKEPSIDVVCSNCKTIHPFIRAVDTDEQKALEILEEFIQLLKDKLNDSRPA